MNSEELARLVREIVAQAAKLRDAHTNEREARANYAAVFSQSEDEYESLLAAANQLGRVVEQTPTGPLFHIAPIATAAGVLRLLKIRKPDSTRPERGDADFTVADYARFKSLHLSKPGFRLIKRPRMELIELMDPVFKVRVYFSNPPLDEQLGI